MMKSAFHAYVYDLALIGPLKRKPHAKRGNPRSGRISSKAQRLDPVHCGLVHGRPTEVLISLQVSKISPHLQRCVVPGAAPLPRSVAKYLDDPGAKQKEQQCVHTL